MTESINLNCPKKSIREVDNKLYSKNIVRSRIPIRIQREDKFTITNASPNTLCAHMLKSSSFKPQKRYGKDRTRMVSNYGKRFGKSAMESQISFKYKKYNWEKSKLVKQQVNYAKECDEMKILLEKFKKGGERESKWNGLDFFDDTKASGDCLKHQFQIHERLDLQDCDLKRQELSAVHPEFASSNTVIFTLLKRLGDNAIQLFCNQTMKTINKKPDDNFLANILKLKTEFLEVTKERNFKLLEYENEIKQLKSSNKDITAKLRLSQQQLVIQASENTSIQDIREESFVKIEEKLRNIIEKLQCQFRTQKLLQAKTESDLAVLRSEFFTLERENSKLTNCSSELEDCHKNNERLIDKVAVLSKENAELMKKYEKQLVASHVTIDRMKGEIMEARNNNNECKAAQMKG